MSNSDAIPVLVPQVDSAPAAGTARSLRMVTGRDAKGNILEVLKGYSTTVVGQAFADSKAIVVTGTDQGKALGSESAVLHNLRSIMAVPLRIREKTIGVVYLDSHLAKGLFTNEDLDLFSAISTHIAIAFETSRMANVEAERRAFEKDMILAAAVQSLFLPKQAVFETEKLTTAGYYQAASQASGDWWWHMYREEAKIATLILGDVTGHGAASAMLTASTAGIFQTLEKMQPDSPIDQILPQLNERFLEISQGNYSMTMGAVEIHMTTGLLRFFNAGGPAVFIMDSEGKVRSMVVAGTPLGNTQFSLGTKQIQLQAGDRVCMATDGITEMILADNSQLRTRRFIKILTASRKMPIREAVQFFSVELKALRGDTPLEDDMSFILADYG